MPISAYSQALDRLDPALRDVIENGIKKLDTQLQTNISNETALQSADFDSVLSMFGTAVKALPVKDAPLVLNAWINACRAHGLKGKIVSNADLPIILGRVKGLAAHAYDIAHIPDPEFDAAEAEQLLRDNANVSNPVGFIASLRDAVLGKYILWATFDTTDTTKNPFMRLPQTHKGICAALGLDNDTAIVVLAWNHQQADAPPLHRPTIADAAGFTLFRPHHDPTSFCGYTGPLPHTPTLDAQPEVVLQSITCKGLTLPYMVFEV